MQRGSPTSAAPEVVGPSSPVKIGSRRLRVRYMCMILCQQPPGRAHQEQCATPRYLCGRRSKRSRISLVVFPQGPLHRPQLLLLGGQPGSHRHREHIVHSRASWIESHAGAGAWTTATAGSDGDYAEEVEKRATIAVGPM